MNYQEKVPTMEHDKMNERLCIFESLKSIAAALSKTFGRNCEIAIHDFDRLPNSLLYIEGGVTKRKPGAPITDLAVRALRREGDNVADICNYKTITKDGMVLKSSTAFVRDSTGKVIGAFCINFCITEYLNTISLLEDFTKITQPNNVERHETFALSLNETMESLIDAAIKKTGRQPAIMSKEEKVNLVSHLENEGAFLIKGAVEFVAKALGVSKYTVYNYLKEVRINNQNNDFILQQV
jgi:predicted transcriptional regulator YheO